jgi:hypothetical protein
MVAPRREAYIRFMGYRDSPAMVGMRSDQTIEIFRHGGLFG